MKELSLILSALHAGSESFALATLVTVEGSSYRRPGARLLLLPDGRRIGSVSGGCLEEDVILRAQRVLACGRAEAAIYDTTEENDLVWGVGLGCHGIVRVLIEPLHGMPPWARAVAENWQRREATPLVVVHDGPDARAFGTCLAEDLPDAPAAGHCFRQTIQPPPSLAIFGAGDDAQPLARLAKQIGWQVVVADPRPAFATRQRFPDADAVVCAAAHELVARLQFDGATAAVVMTHHYVHDVPILGALLLQPLAYVGLLGPRKRAEKILSDLAGRGVSVSAEQRGRLHAPVGLDLGADAPEQVALAIVAEIQAALSGRDARPLRERIRPIHA